jgi:hypothetical protein
VRARDGGGADESHELWFTHGTFIET